MLELNELETRELDSLVVPKKAEQIRAIILEMLNSLNDPNLEQSNENDPEKTREAVLQIVGSTSLKVMEIYNPDMQEENADYQKANGVVVSLGYRKIREIQA